MVVEGHVAGALAPSDRGRGGLGGPVSRPSALIAHFQTRQKGKWRSGQLGTVPSDAPVASTPLRGPEPGGWARSEST